MYIKYKSLNFIHLEKKCGKDRCYEKEFCFVLFLCHLDQTFQYCNAFLACSELAMVGLQIPEKHFVQCHHVIRGSIGPKLAKSPGISLQRLINFLRKGLYVRYSTELQNEIAVQGALCSNMGKDLEPMHDDDTLVCAGVYH